MRLALVWLRESLLTLGFVLLALAGLLLLPFLAIAIRPLLMLALAGGAVVACFSPRFRHWLES